ncbi:MAG: helix-turn-helix domain-containing protein [Syntrophales bacterium]|nr:helix-turn-helix domain-containing protein [Syntrophales bacterium]MDD5233998.1 helix-turn-helix domain-containing protein [Syntrophales bacterium]MDD5533948.1 helix-turn-helix domain-containing protein [Syntrophales bacterium]HPL62712.1 helix-turn-helix domain-containing protein [Syntrophales bacterium]
MTGRNPKTGRRRENVSCSEIEEILEKRIEDIVNFIGSHEKGKSSIYDDVLSMIDKCLIRIALRRCDGVKTAAAVFLGINRNTLHKKIDQLGIGEGK